ncbi:MAG TPA: ABC transporter permease [Trebonia sp.]|jgi:peptide/nickel transport system permease protein
MTATTLTPPGGEATALPRRARPRPRSAAAARYLARKLGFYIVAAWVAITLNFFLPRLIPGNPVQVIMAHQAHFGTVPAGEAAALTKILGLGHGSLAAQYWQYLGSLAHLQLGLSVFEFPTPVAAVIGQSIGWTIVLVGLATVISFVVGIGLGVLTGWKRGTWLDSLVPATTFLTAMPYFWLALLLVYLFAQALPVFPSSGGYDPLDTIGFNGAFIVSAVEHSVLPALTIVISSIGGWLLGMRNMMVATLSDDYVVAAEAKGIKPRKVMIGYAARNAVLPSVSGFAISLGFVVSGSIVMEQVFNYPGIGNVLFQAVSNDDYPLMQGIFLVITLTVLAANLLVDLLYGIIDPRTRIGAGS